MADRPTPAESRIAMPPLIQTPFSRRLSWSALFAGVVVTFALEPLLTVLATGIGTATDGAKPGGGLAVGLVLSGVIAFYCGGWTSGRLAGIPRAIESTLHGFLTWSLAMVIGMALLSSGVGGLLGNIAGASLGGSLVMLLGGGAASLGGWISTPKNRILTRLPAWERRRSR